MARVPTICRRDAKRLNREASAWSGRTRHRQPNEGPRGRLGVRNFQTHPAQGQGASCNGAHPEGTPLPRHVLAELPARHGAAGLVAARSGEIEAGRSETELEQEPETGDAMVRQVDRVIGIALNG